jgi:hypothetical protein
MKRYFALLGLAAFGGAQAIVIDDFTTGPYSNMITAGSVIAQQNGNMQGLQRDVMMTVLSNVLSQHLELNIGNGMTVTNSGTLLRARIGLQYDGTDVENPTGTTFNNGAGFSPTLDLSNQTHISIGFLANDLNLSLEARLHGSGESMAIVNVPGNQTSPFVVDIPLTAFQGTANLSTVSNMSFIFETSPSGDFAIGGINVVPEPTTLIVFGGLLSLLALRKRR